MNKNEKGYSLIELLVVMAIISLMFVVTLKFFSDSRAKARDAKRLQHVEKIQQALEIYYNRNGRYPDPAGSTNINSGWADSNSAASWAALSATMNMELPVDPLNTSGHTINQPDSAFNYAYFSHPTAYCGYQGYMLHFNLEKKDSPGPELVYCNIGNTGTLSLYNADGYTLGVGPNRNIIRPSVQF